LVLVQSETESKGWNNHEDTFEEALRRELLSARTEIYLLQQDLKELTSAYYKLLRNRMEYFIDKLREDLENDEGNKKSIYLCSEGHPTFGIGHLVTKNDPEYGKEVGTKVSHERVHNVFESDIATTIKDCGQIFEDWDKLPEEIRLVTANMCFQLGMPNLLKFKKTIDACNRGSWHEMGEQMRDSRWNKQTPNRSERLIKRVQALGQNQTTANSHYE